MVASYTFKKRFRDLTGEKFERLTVLKRVENSHNGHLQYLCRCDCGSELIVKFQSLTKNKSKSCGCLRSENMKAFNAERKKAFELYRNNQNLGDS